MASRKQGKRAEYGAQIVSALGRQLTSEYGRDFSAKNLRHMMTFFDAFQDEQIVSALRRQLSCPHFKSPIYIEDPLKRDFSPVGIILCAGKKREQIELLELRQSGIHVAEYLTELPDEKLLRKKLNQVIQASRPRLENREGDKA